MSTRAFLIVDHGSRREAPAVQLEAIASLVRARLGPNARVYAAHMEIADPNVPSVIERCIRDGANHITVVPYFLFDGRHAAEDIPALVKDALASHPEVSCTIAGVLGVDELLAELVVKRAKEVDDTGR